MQQLAKNAMNIGGLPIHSPQNLLDMLRAAGIVPTVKLSEDRTMTEVSWTTERGEGIGMLFFDDLAQCKGVVEKAINSGLVPAPGSLR